MIKRRIEMFLQNDALVRCHQMGWRRKKVEHAILDLHSRETPTATVKYGPAKNRCCSRQRPEELGSVSGFCREDCSFTTFRSRQRM